MVKFLIFKTCQSKFYLFREGLQCGIILLLGWSLLGWSVLSLVSLQHFLLLKSLSLLSSLPGLLHLQTTSLGLENKIAINLSEETKQPSSRSALLSLIFSHSISRDRNIIIISEEKCQNGLTWSCSCLVLAFSAFFLWMNSIKTLLFLKTFPLALRYSSW